MRSLSIHTHTELKQTVPESPDVAEVEYRWGWGGGRKQRKGGRGFDKASSRASNSILTDLLPIR